MINILLLNGFSLLLDHCVSSADFGYVTLLLYTLSSVKIVFGLFASGVKNVLNQILYFESNKKRENKKRRKIYLPETSCKFPKKICYKFKLIIVILR